MKRLLALAIVIVAVLATFVLIRLGPKPTQQHVEPLVPPVEFVTAEPTRHRLVVRTQGTVSPAVETVLIPEVSGRIIEVSPRFDAGGFFEEGEVLLKIEPTNYEAAAAEAQARLAAAQLALAQEDAASAQAEQDWRELGRGEPTSLAKREPQRARARAEIDAARNTLAVARRNLERTVIRAPYAGRVREKSVDLGQVVAANSTRLGVIYGIATAELRLPLTLREIGLLDLPESYRGEGERVQGPAVTLEADYGGERHAWRGTIARVEGVIEPRTRVVHAVAVVRDPYRREPGAARRPPLKVGLFVEAAIAGRELDNVFVLPRAVLVSANELFVIDAENRLRRRRVNVVHSDTENVVISEGLSAGDRINRTPIEFFIEGMAVKPERNLPESSSKARDRSVNLEGWRSRLPGKFLVCQDTRGEAVQRCPGEAPFTRRVRNSAGCWPSPSHRTL